MSVTNGGNIYATELFGPGHGSPKYPIDLDPNTDGNQDGTPMVVLTIPGNLNAQAADASLTPPRAASPARNHDGSAEIRFELTGGAVFDANITGLMYDADGAATTESAVAAIGTIASIMAGGRKNDNYVTIKIEEASDAATTRPAPDALDRETDGSIPDAITSHSISFSLPRLASLGHLAGADSTDMNPNNNMKSIAIKATATIRSGAFSDGLLTGTKPPAVINSYDAVTLEVSDKNEKMIPIDGEMAFTSVEGANKDGYVMLATVTVKTMPIKTDAKPAKKRQLIGYLQGAATETEDTPNDDVEVYLPGMDPTKAVPHKIYGMDGDLIDEGLRGNLMVKAMGTRELFNEGDKLFIDYDGNKMPGPGEEMPLSGDMMDMALSGALSIDPDKSESFNDAGVGAFGVYYKPDGKGSINHGAMINLTAMVDYSDPSAINEKDESTSTTLKFKGIAGDGVKAYAIPHSTNGTGDKGNLRVRCEVAAGCRVFLECWDDMGERGFDEAPMIAGNNVMVWDGAAIEGVTGLEPSSRMSCRILSKGMVSVQQLTRDGNSKTLVNNTYVSGS
ncbi:MAG: hypothetical protein OXQ29_24190 [Rhodospirillaceae bacterium]|nr:hypothetical protein [Rhodospirillaceae bacterium]